MIGADVETRRGSAGPWATLRNTIISAAAAVGFLLAAWTLRSLFATDSLNHWTLASDAVIEESALPAFPGQPQLVTVSSGLRFFSVRTGRGRLLLEWRSVRPNPMASHAVPRHAVDRWNWHSRSPAEPPALNASAGMGGWSLGGTGVRWTQPTTNFAFDSVQIGLPLPLLSVLFVLPLAMMLIQRRRNGLRRGFALDQPRPSDCPAKPAGLSG